MRRVKTLRLVVAGALLSFSLPAHAHAPDAEAFVVQEARAEWIVRTNNGLRIFIVYADRWSYQHSPTEPDAVGTAVMVGRGRCRMIHSGHEVECRAHVMKKAISLDGFWIDPRLEEARVSFQMRGRRHWVEWRGSGMAPTAQHDGYVRVGAAGGMIGLFRTARARGQLLGTKVVPQRTWLHKAELAQRAVFDSTFLSDGGRDVYIRRYPVRSDRG